MKTKRKSWVKEVTVGRISVTIRRRKAYKGGWRYIVEDWSSGERKQKTDLYTEEDAIEEATRIANLLSTGNVQAAQMSQDDAMELIRSRNTLQPFGLTVSAISEWAAMALKKVGDIHKLNEALNFYSLRHKKITDKAVQKTIDDLLEQKKKDKASERYIQSLKSCYNRFAKSFACNIGDIHTPQIKTFLDGIGKDPQTRLNNRRMLNVLFEYAVECGHAIDNPVKGIKKIKVKAKETPIYQPDDIVKLLNACEPDILPCIAIGAFAGLRPAEILRLDWSEVDMAQKHIKVRLGIAKTASRRIVPIQDNLLAWLTSYKDSKGKVWKHGYYPFYRKQKKTFDNAKIELLDDALRHSYGSYRLAQIQNASQVATEIGNSETVVYKHYIEVVTQADAKNYFAIAPEKPDNVVKTYFSKAASP